MVDSANPWNTSTILEAVEHLEKPLKRIIVTHAHPDHAGAAASISAKTGADVYVHEDDLLYLRGEDCMTKAPGSLICRRVLESRQAVRNAESNSCSACNWVEGQRNYRQHAGTTHSWAHPGQHQPLVGIVERNVRR